jgi:hypothetical protein
MGGCLVISLCSRAPGQEALGFVYCPKLLRSPLQTLRNSPEVEIP